MILRFITATECALLFLVNKQQQQSQQNQTCGCTGGVDTAGQGLPEQGRTAGCRATGGSKVECSWTHELVAGSPGAC